jgi:WD40 repeat protein
MLKSHLEECLGINVFRFAAGDTAELCRQVQQSLENVVRAQCESFGSRPALDLEIEAHDEFARDRARPFTGRESVLSAIANYIRDDDRRPLVLHGASGSGKSAVIAKASAQLAETLPDAVVVRRFIGVTPESSDGLTLLRSICQQIGGEGEIPVGLSPLTVTFRERLASGTANHPLTVFIDALDQLAAQDPACSLTWLPAELPPHCRVVVSAIGVPDALRQARAIEVDVLPPHEAEEALDAWLRDARRALQPEQRWKLLDHFGHCGLPLYLKLAFEEARRWRSFDRLGDCVLGNGLVGIIDGLLDRLSAESNHGPVMVSRSLGYLTVARYGLTEDEILSVLTADDEVWEDFERRRRHDPLGRRLPVIVWSRLSLDLGPYLAEHAAPGGTVISFYHRQLPERVAARFLAGSKRQQRHRNLAEHFARRSNWLDEEKRLPNLRRITEMVRHQVPAGMLDEAEATLTDLDFLSAKCCAGLVFDLQEDYRSAISVLPEAQPALREEARRQAEAARWTREIIEYSRQWTTGAGRPPLPELIQSARLWSNKEIEAECQRIVEHVTRLDRLRAFAGFVEQECYPLLEFGVRPGFVVQHAINHSPAGPVHEAAEQMLAALEVPLLMKAWGAGARGSPKPALVRTLVGHTPEVACLDVTADGRRAVSVGDATVRVWDLETGACLKVLEGHQQRAMRACITADGWRAVSGSWDLTARVWDLESGSCIKALEGHGDWADCLSVTPDGQRAVSGGSALRLWDLKTGDCLRAVGVQGVWHDSVSIMPDGWHAVSASSDGKLRWWNLEAGECLRVLEGHTGRVTSVSVAADDRRAVSVSDDTTARVWDLATGVCLQVLREHPGMLRTVSATADGRWAVAAGGNPSEPGDGRLLLWNLETGECWRALEGHVGWVNSVCVTADGRSAVSGGFDSTIRVWDLATGAPRAASEGHCGPVYRVTVTADGRLAVSGGADKTLRVWDLETGGCLRVLRGHGKQVLGVSVAPDGRRAVSGSSDGTLRVWDLNTGACLHVLQGHTGSVESVAVTAGGRLVLSTGFDETVRVWDLESGKAINVLKGIPHPMTLSVALEGRHAATGGLDAKPRLWDLESGKCLAALQGHVKLEGTAGWAPVVSLTADGRRLVSGGLDRTLRVWDFATRECLRVLRGHTDRVNDASVTPDGLLAVSTGPDMTVRLWDLGTGLCVALARLSSSGRAVALSPALGRVVVGTQSGEVVQFNLRGTNFGDVLGRPATRVAPREDRESL